MTTLDAAVLLGMLLVAAPVLPARIDRRWLRRAVIAVAALAALQWLLEGAYWHFLPAYALLLAAARAAFFARRAEARASWLARASLVALALLALLPWLVFLPVPELPAPRGPYAVGTQVFRWIDDSRPEPRTVAPDDLRNVIVQAWYPAAAGARGPRAPYIDGLGRLPRFVSLFPGLAMAYYDHIDTHAVAGALPAAARSRWPVVLFSPGHGAPRAFYTGLVTDLASRGFVVLAVDHPYEVAVTELVGGRIATAIERSISGHAGWTAYMTQELDVRTADLRFVLDRIAQPEALGPLSDHLDLDHVAAIGHSFGGAAAVLAMARDARIAAAANIDGTLYGTLPEQHLQRPVLLLESDRRDTGHSPSYIDGNRRLLHNARAAAYHFEIRASHHYSFTDAPLFFSPPARLALALCIGGSRGAPATQHAAIDILVAFLAPSLGLPPADVEAAAARHGDIGGGRVSMGRGPAPAGERVVRGRGIACVGYEGHNGYAALVADVDVHVATGVVHPRRYVIAHDCGPISNPDGLRNQIEGGLLQGTSRALVEEVTWDERRVTSVDWSSYASLHLDYDVPAIETVFVTPAGVPAAGAGETSITLVPAAIGNAVFDATGARLRDVPFTPARVLAALRDAGSGSLR